MMYDVCIDRGYGSISYCVIRYVLQEGYDTEIIGFA